MTSEEFIVKTKLLEDYYGKDLNYTQREFWYNELKKYDAEKYEKAINYLCKTMRYRPLLNEIIDVMRQIKKESNIEHQIVPCELCKGTGYILYTRVENNRQYQYACLCLCQNAVGLEYNGMEIEDKEHRNPYYIKTAQEALGESIKLKPAKTSTEKQRPVNNLIANLGKQMSF